MSTTRALISNGGKISKLADAALIRYRLVCEGSDADHVKYPAAVTDRPIGITLDGAQAAESIAAIALLGRGDTKIVKLNGTCSKGDWLTAEDPATAAVGQARKVPTTAGAYWVIGRALEGGADEQEIAMDDCFPFIAGSQHANGQLSVAGYTADPTTPSANQVWENMTDHSVNVWVNGAKRTFTFVALVLAFMLAVLAVRAGDVTPAKVVNATTGQIGSVGASDNAKFAGTIEVTGAINPAGGITGYAIGANVQAYDADLTTYAGITPSANIQSLLGCADYSAARTALGLAIGTNVQAYDADLTTYAGITPSANIQSLLGCADYSAARTALGLAIGTNVQAYDADLTTWAGVTPSANGQSLVSAADYSAMRTALTLVPGTDVQAYDADLAYLAGFTPTANVKTILNAADFAAVRTACNLVPGTDIQAYDADLATWAGVTPSANGQSLVSAADYSAMRTALTLVPGTDVQAYDADLAYLAGFTPTANVKTILNAADFAAVRTACNLVPGTDIQAYDADLATWAGVTPTANGQSLVSAANYAAMRTLLDLEVGTDFNAYDADLTTYAGITPSANVQSLLGCADYAAMRTALTLVPGTNVQAYDADLATFAGISPSANVQTLLGCADNAAIAAQVAAAVVEGGLANSTIVTADIKDGEIVDADVNASAAIANTKLALPAIRTVSQAITVAEFTDDLGASGRMDLSTQIPAQSVVLGWKMNATGAWDGDVSAAITVGTAGATTCFSADTDENIFGITKVGSGSVAATSYVNAATTVRVTVTTNADFTSCKTANNGAGTITVYYLGTE